VTRAQGVCPESQATDASLITESLVDGAVFGGIFERHATTIHRYLVRRVGPWDADSITGEVFEIAFRRRADFDQSYPSARPWLYGIATNLLTRRTRSEARRLHATARLAAQPPLELDLADAVVDRVDLRARHEAAATAVTALAATERDVLLLFAWEELSYDEIAQALDIPVGTVRSRLNRGRNRLRTAIRDQHTTENHE